MLIEVLCSLLIFAIGILAMVGLQAVSVQQSTAARYRAIAATQANDLISRMWVSDRTAATLQASFASSSSSTTNTGYASWYAAVQACGLPKVSAQPPTVTFTTVVGGGSSATSSSLATITIYWTAPGETIPSGAKSAHKYVAMAQIK
jgi:type IV pilus assembly protein PilV